MNSFSLAPAPDEDERRLRMLEEAIRSAEEADRREAARKAEEERLARERAAIQPLTVEQLKAQADALRAKIIEKQTHLRADAERDQTKFRLIFFC